MPTAKKIYTFNETIVETGAALLTGETDEEYTASMEAALADESNYIAVVIDGTPVYLVPMYLTVDTAIYVIATQTKPVDPDTMTGGEIVHLSSDGDVIYSVLAGSGMEITDMGGRAEWIAANTTSRTQIDVESPNGVKLLLEDKLGKENIAVVPKLTEQTVTPTTETQTVSAPEGYAGFRSFIVNKIPSKYVIPEGERTFTENGTHDVSKIKTAVIDVPIPDGYVPEGTVPDGYVPEGTVPDGYVKPEGAITVTENVTDMDISEKKTLTVAVEGGSKLNIAYGDTAPTDTSKLWVKTAEPAVLQMKAKVDYAGGELTAGISSLPTAVRAMGAAAVGTKIYLFGGIAGYSVFDTINVFNTETGTIETLSATLPAETYYMSAESVGTKIYLFGGLDNRHGELNTINVFNTDTGTIETLFATLPEKMYDMGTAVVGTMVYLFGGVGDESGKLNTISVFNTETGVITTLSETLPTAANAMGAAAVGTKVYLFGGYVSDGRLNTISVFDTETRTFETLSETLPTAAGGIKTAAVGTKVYLFGGYSGGYLNTISVFDTETRTFETLSETLPAAMSNMGAAAVGTKVYLFGGTNGSDLFSSIHLFTVTMALAENNMLIEGSVPYHVFKLLPNVEMGVKNVYLGGADGKGERVAAALYQDGAWVEI